MNVAHRFTHLVLYSLLLSTQQVYPQTQVLFSPDDKPRNALISKINNAKKQIQAAIYMLTDKKIAAALESACFNRSIDVQIVTDASCLGTEYEKVSLLAKAGAHIFVYKGKAGTGKYRYNSLMHHKFAVIDESVWTGSFNWTASAAHRNQENVIIVDDEKVVKRYKKQFELLKRRCAQSKPKSKIITKKQQKPGALNHFFKAMRKRFTRK